MVSGNKKKRKNNRNNKKNKIKRANQANQDAPEVNKDETEQENNESVDDDRDQQNSNVIHSEDNSDAEDEPKKKKRKKQTIPSNSTDKKGGKSIRQMKREKHAERQAEVAAASKDQLKSQCVTYLSQWKHDRQNWKFMKAKQVWLYKNKFSSYLLPDSSWPVFLEYFESAKGNIRNLLLNDANKVIKQMDDWTESQSNTERNTKEEEKNEETAKKQESKEIERPDDTAYKRARDLIQCLH